ncbi:MAG TPA: VCBS repeat-containing protein, partial [Polyangiaceae bacterium]
MTSQTPTLELEPGDDCGPLVVELCSTRACESIVETVAVGADGLSAKPSMPLEPGVVFWRARSGQRISAVWQFTVGADTPTDTWWGTIPDFNGDGYVDVAVGTLSDVVYVYYGSDEGLLAETPTVIESPDPSEFVFGHALASAGDVNGDGFADLVVGSREGSDAGP